MWTIAAIALLACMVGPFVRCVRGDTVSRLVALQAGSSICTVVLLVLCEAYHRTPFVDLALTLATFRRKIEWLGMSRVLRLFLRRSKVCCGWDPVRDQFW